LVFNLVDDVRNVRASMPWPISRALAGGRGTGQDGGGPADGGKRRRSKI